MSFIKNVTNNKALIIICILILLIVIYKYHISCRYNKKTNNETFTIYQKTIKAIDDYDDKALISSTTILSNQDIITDNKTDVDKNKNKNQYLCYINRHNNYNCVWK